MGELQVIGGLRDKRAELVALVGRLEQQLADHRVSLTHLDATLRLFDPNLLLPDSGPQQRARVSWFRPGECLRAIYDVLRDSPQPLTTRDVAGRVIAAKGITVADDRTQALIQKTALVQSSWLPVSRCIIDLKAMRWPGFLVWTSCSRDATSTGRSSSYACDGISVSNSATATCWR
jgi:hypothetical protein